MVLYPGWFVEEPHGKFTVWVLNEKRLLGYVKHDPRTLDEPTIARLAAALAPHARASDPA